MKFDPNADYTKRRELLRLMLDRGISQEKINEIVAPMGGCSHEEKERMAAELIPIIESGIYDCYPRHFYHKTQWHHAIHEFYGADEISYDTARPIVQDMLCYCKLSKVAVESILAVLGTGEHLRQMYEWLMGQTFVPEESACVAKAKEIDTALSKRL